MVSIVIPVYKAEKYINRCLASVTGQTYTEIEIWLIDDCSPDLSGKICDEWSEKDDRIHVIHHARNIGVAGARNTALDAIERDGKSDYIAFVDSDDYVHPFFIQEILGLCREYACDISWIGHCEVADFEDIRFSQPIPERLAKPVVMDARTVLLSREQSILYSLLWNKLFAADLWAGVRFPEECSYYSDGATTFRVIYKANKIVKSDIVLYYYYLSASSNVRSNYSEKKMRDALFTQTEKIKFYERYSEMDLVCIAQILYTDDIIAALAKCRELPNGRELYAEMKVLYRTVYRKTSAYGHLTRQQRTRYFACLVYPGIKGMFNQYIDIKQMVVGALNSVQSAIRKV